MSLHLAIEASPVAIKFTVLKGHFVRDSHAIVIEGNNSSLRKSSIEEQCKALTLLNDDFDEITLSWSNKNSTLIPNFVLNDSDPKSIFSLCFGAETEDFSVDYNRISELGVINIYEIPNWIKSYFVIRFPKVIIQHTGSHTVRKAMNDNAFYLKANIVLFDGYFLLSLVKHNKLEFYSFFDYLKAEDVIYHLTFALQQKELIDEKGLIELAQGIESEKSIIEKIQALKERIGELNKMEVAHSEDFTAKSQLLCV